MLSSPYHGSIPVKLGLLLGDERINKTSRFFNIFDMEKPPPISCPTAESALTAIRLLWSFMYGYIMMIIDQR